MVTAIPRPTSHHATGEATAAEEQLARQGEEEADEEDRADQPQDAAEEAEAASITLPTWAGHLWALAIGLELLRGRLHLILRVWLHIRHLTRVVALHAVVRTIRAGRRRCGSWESEGRRRKF